MAVETFGAWLKARRRRLDLTQQALAERSSCSVVTIRKIEQGDRRPSKQLAALMAAALQVPAEQVAEFVAFARHDPDSTLVPPGLQPSDLPLTLRPSVPESIDAPSDTQPRIVTLPRSTTPFLGREAEVTALLDYVEDPACRLISILGPGGMGKTRLAVAVAERLADGGSVSFADGIVFVSLAALTDVNQIGSVIADALTMLVDGTRDVTQQLLDYLAPRQVLLIVDNCEHLLDGIGLLVEIVQAAPGVTVLATSRERLHLQGEQAYPIDGLDALDLLDPDPDVVMAHPAIRLFSQSAQRAAPTFALTSEDVPHVAHICRLANGMPLGIELSAGWVGMMSLAEIATEVQQNLDFLASDFRDLPPRHRSMRAVFDASWQHLDPIEQSVFRQLSVFRGGFTRQAAADVTEATLRHLGHLIYKSLLHYDRTRNRYWLHELLRQYGTDKLAEDATEATRASVRHGNYFIERLSATLERLQGKDQAGALAELDDDIDNVRLAWRTAIARGEGARLYPAMDTLGFYYEWRVRLSEGRQAFQRLAEAIDPRESAHARMTYVRALAWQAAFLRQAGKPDVALELLDEAVAHCEHPVLDAQTQQVQLAFIAYQRGYCLERRQNERALACFRESVARWEACGDSWWTALGLGGLGHALSWSNHFIEARAELTKSVEIFERHGHVRELVFLHNRLCDSSIFKGEFSAAREHGERAAALADEVGNKKGKADALRNLATINLLADNNLSHAETLTNQALTFYRALGVQLESALCLAAIGSYRLTTGEVEDGRRHFEEARALFAAQQLRQGDGYTLRWLAIADAMAGQQAEALEKIGRSIDIFTEVGAVNYIPHLHVIRFLIDKERSSPVQARPWLVEILRDALEIREYFDVYWSLSSLAYVWLIDQSPTDGGPLPQLVAMAAEIRGFVRESLEYGRSAFMRALVHDEVDAMLAQWPPQEVDAAQAQGSDREMWALAASVLSCLDEIEGAQHSS